MNRIVQTLLLALTITLFVVGISYYVQKNTAVKDREKELREYRESFSWKEPRYDYLDRLHEGTCNEKEQEYMFTQDDGEPYLIKQFINLSSDFTTEFAIVSIEPDGFMYKSSDRNCPNYSWVEKMSKRAFYDLLNIPFEYERNGAVGKRMMVEGALVRGTYWDIHRYDLKRSSNLSYEVQFQPERTTKTQSYTEGRLDNISYKLQNSITTQYYKVSENKYNIDEQNESSNKQLVMVGLITFLSLCVVIPFVMKRITK